MEYLVFGFATGIFVCGLIEKFHKKESGWIKPSYLFGLSALGFAFFIYLAWPRLVQIFS